jgi:two-component system, OmpR family, sensor histidine kinase KdpD
MTQKRTRAEDFLELVERSKRGRLKVYLGFAAGVGKTYRMLEEAHALRARGVDVVLGFIEPHDRKETRELVADLPAVPRKLIPYRGIDVEEMDLDAVLARRPQVIVVDEVAHTNAPGLKHRKRYEDVIELIDAGINVICAFNVQHLESLNDLVERTTGVVVRERVPDSFLKQADQVITLDLAVEDLLERLRAGKIYGTEKIPWALEHFFQEQNLATLRELALREVVESVERAAAPAGRGDSSRPRAATGKVMVCMSSYSPRAAALLRRGSRTAGRLNTDWYVVYVETPGESPQRIDAGVQRHLLENVSMAKELGAEVVRLKGHDPVATLLEFARSHDVGLLIIGRSHRPGWLRSLRRDVVQRLINEADGVDVLVVALVESVSAP